MSEPTGDDGDELNPAEVVGPRADDAPPIAVPKSIILFSDGTGNSSGKLFKTNVFRLYEALDLGPDSQGQRLQVAYYDNGVGTSSVKLFAVLGGVFGFGLKRNLISLYRFLCRNYNPGDRIYAFGFSRGSFTIRLLVALVGRVGIVPYEDERELARNTKDAYRRFASLNDPDFFPWLARLARFVRDGLIGAVRRLRGEGHDVPGNPVDAIRFVGVWDTVAAYGGPVAEITRAIDKWIWPLTMTDYKLGDHVLRARHALALDDERDSFWPLLWDEVHESRAADKAITPADQQKYRTRLQQVWFSGMHSDVGGGYPDESLSYVSLNWMIGEIGTELRLVPERLQYIQAMANIFGPVHDSRSGLGGYYRYQPRRVDAFLHPDADGSPRIMETQALRDPTVGEKGQRPQGLLLGCKVHDSVLLRIATGTDNYAPIVLPRSFQVVGTKSPAGAPAQHRSAQADAVFAKLTDPAIAQARSQRQEVLWDIVWCRRMIYFLTVAVTVALAASPLWIGSVPPIPPRTDGRWVLGIVIGWLGAFVPSAARPWFEAFSSGPAYFVLAAVPIVLFGWVGTALERSLRDRTRRLWWSAMAGQVAALPTTSRLKRFRDSIAYQATLQQLKWRIAPTIVGIGLIVAIPYGIGIVYLQGWLALHEPRQDFCRDAGPPPPALDGHGTWSGFSAGSVCNAVHVGVIKDHRYRLTFNGDGWTDPKGRHQPGWADGAFKVREGGAPSSAYLGEALVMYLGAPFRRVVPARWLEPLVEVRSGRDAPAGGPAASAPVVDIERLTNAGPAASSRNRYSGEFVASGNGALFLFVNDAVLPFGSASSRYGPGARSRNSGTASVTIEDLSAPGAAIPSSGARGLGTR